MERADHYGSLKELREGGSRGAGAMMDDVSGVTDVLQEAHQRVRQAYGRAVGKQRDEIVTPALILDLPAARRNITKMADRMRSMPS